MMPEQVYVQHEKLQAFVSAIFEHVGMDEEDANWCARCLVNTNLWGVDSHGVLRVPVYVKRFRSGLVNPRPQMGTVKSTGAMEVIDGNNGPGYLVGREAMERAIKLAQTFGVGMVGAINSNHFGAAAIYARMALDQEMIGIAMTNVGPQMVVDGGSRPVVGNNPVAVAIPTYQTFPFVLDISLSAVAGGKLRLARKTGTRIPLNWAVDREGHPTDDPDKAAFYLPIGGHKGVGLAYVVDILCGVITGGCFLSQVQGTYSDHPSGTGHMMIALNQLAFIDRDDLRSRMADFCRMVKSSPMRASSAEMLLPGEIEYRTALERTRNGIPLPVAVCNDLVELGRDLGLPWKQS